MWTMELASSGDFERGHPIYVIKSSNFEDKLFKLINSTKRRVQAKHKSISLFPVQ